jgi:alanine racemase
LSERALTYIEVDLKAIAHNVRAIKQHIGPSVELLAVLKANAYGHGAVEIGCAVMEYGADRLAVARVSEGLELREGGVDAPVLVMGYVMPHEIETAIAHDLTLTVTERETAQALSARAVALGRSLPVHVKVDSGMGRFGVLAKDAVAFVDWLAELPGLALEGVFSHFAVSDLADKTYTRQQLRTFLEVVACLEAAGYHVPVRHVANSAAMLDLPETHLDAVRPGIAVYGLPPSAEVEPTIPLQPALSLKSHVVRVETLPAGASISYGRTYITPRAMRVALVPVGYGDGYHRQASNRGAVLINGQRAPILGRVCMDQFVVDVSRAGPVALNDEVVLLGHQGDDQITAEEIATWTDTINYEVVTALLQRVPRFYLPAS